jgi:phage anti-repressor protein
METLDIVDMIEKNPITKLSNTFNNRLLIKIKENFNEDEQKLFITSFYCYLNYNQKNDFVIDLDNIWKWLDFKQKVNAKNLIEKNFIINIDYNISLLLEQKQNKKHGGNNKETILLTINTFKLFCIKAGTKKAKQIHEYFIKLEELLHEVIQEESNELRLQLEKQLEQKNDEIINIKLKNNEELLIEKDLQREKILLREFGTIGSIIYIIRVKTLLNGNYIIKIGESRIGIQNRYNEHKTNYEEILLLDCFIVNKSRDFESFLHNHENIKENRVNDLLGHENERELFLIGKNLTYNMLINIIKNNIKYFNHVNESDIEKLKLECENLKLESENLKLLNTQNNNNDKNIINIFLNKTENIEKSIKEILEKINNMQIKTTNNFNETLSTLGPRLQKINPDNFQIIKIYESVSECMKENILIKRPSINKAIIENTIYHGFRWLLVSRDLDPNIIYNIEETKDILHKNIGYVAKLNSGKTEIVNVYIDKKTASLENGYKSSSALDNPMKKFTITNGFYYIFYNNCNEELKNKFKRKNNDSDPILYKNGIGQYDLHNNLIKEFICKYDCIKSLRISDRTLTKALDSNKSYNNYFYKYIGSKIKSFDN